MRLTPAQISTTRSTVHDVLGGNARGWLFGSRLDDSRQGGDVDLLIQALSEPVLLQHTSDFAQEFANITADIPA